MNPTAEVKLPPISIQLMTAAPDLLALLIEGREWYPSEHGTGKGAQWRQRVEASIRKAKGEAA